MRKKIWIACAGLALTAMLYGCGGSGGSTVTLVPTYTLTVNSASPATGVAITVSPADNDGLLNGTTSFTRLYTSGTMVTLTAPAKSGANTFTSWSGCSVSALVTCQVTVTANTTVTANYTAPVTGKTYYVSGTGSDTSDGLTQATAFLTLQHAANLTQPGDTVYALNGTYSDPDPCCAVLDISTPGTASAPITYTAFPGQTPVISFNGWEGVFFEPTAAYIEVSGFTVTGNNANVTLTEAQAQSTTDPNPAFNGNCIAADGRKGTAAQKPNHLKILNNIISECGGAGVGTAQSDYITISGNTIWNTSWYSIYGSSAISTWENWPTDSVTGYKMFITGNTLYGNAELVPVASYGQITDGEAIILDTLNNNYAGSTIGPYTGRTYVANNVIYSNGSAAIEVFDSQHADVVNNSTYGNVLGPALNGRGEMNLNEAADVNVVNNIFYSATGQNPVTVLGSCPGCTLNYNLYFNGANNSTIGNGPADLTADPLYLAPAATNTTQVSLKVQSTSPAVGSGTATLAPTTDINGNPRPGAKGYDRGAYQQ